MAKIVKEVDEKNQSPAFKESNKIIRKYVIKRNLLIRIILLLIAGASYFLYYKEVIEQSQYLIYFSSISIILFLFSFIFLRTRLTDYQEYHATKLSKQDKEAIARYNDKVKGILSEDSFHLLNNIYLPCGGEYLQQLDSILIAPTNIYVLELLNLEGVIEGMASGKRWKSSSGEKIINNYQQNKKHVNEIKGIIYDILPNEKVEVKNLVINLNMNSNFNMPDKASHPIFDNLYDALYWIKEQERKYELEIDDNKREIITQSLIKIHQEALKKIEYNLNKMILKKYNLKDKFLK